LKCLGLGNHKALWGVVGIQDVLAVQAKVESEERIDRARVGGGDHDEEMEDGEGNVYSRKTYEDLQRQGLI
jgi:splicing factor 3A subunit 3